MPLKFTPPPEDARTLGQANGANIDRKAVEAELKAAQGQWAQVYGDGTDAPDGAIRSTISEWKQRGFEVRMTELPAHKQKNPNNKRFNVWLMWPGGQAPAVPVPPAPPAAPNTTSPEAASTPPLVISEPTAPDAETAPAVAVVPTDTPKTGFQAVFGNVRPEDVPQADPIV